MLTWTPAGLHVVATAGSADLDYVRGLGTERVVDYKKERFEESVTGVTTARLNTITELFESAELVNLSSRRTD